MFCINCQFEMKNTMGKCQYGAAVREFSRSILIETWKYNVVVIPDAFSWTYCSAVQKTALPLKWFTV